MFRRNAAHEEEHGIDLAPMLDFVLNLLIFFIITTSFVRDPGTEVNRAIADTAAARESANILVAVRENGEVWVDRRNVDLRELRSVVERMHIERPQDSAVIVADAASGAGVVARVMDEVRLGGVRDVLLGAVPSVAP